MEENIFDFVHAAEGRLVQMALLMAFCVFMCCGCGAERFFRSDVEFTLPQIEGCVSWRVAVRSASESYCFERSGGSFFLNLEKNHPTSVLAFPRFEKSAAIGEGDAFLAEAGLDLCRVRGGVYDEPRVFYDACAVAYDERRGLYDECVRFLENAGLVVDFVEERPYGAVYPWVQGITELHGFSATVLDEFYVHAEKSGNSVDSMKQFIATFNWRKFCGTLELYACMDEKYSPWNLNRRKILESIEERRFSISLLKM